MVSLVREIAYWPNRDELYTYLDGIINRANSEMWKIALLVMDLDDFREFCEIYGYQAIDNFLNLIGQVIKENCPDNSWLAWLGSDEFAVVLYDTDQEQATNVAQTICEAVAQPISFKGRIAQVGVSLGISLFPVDAVDRYELLKNATVAMNWVKKNGKNSYRFYDRKMSEEINRKVRLTNDFSVALVENQFILHYQPQINIFTGMISGAEALVRWQHPELGLIPPGDFIPLAEENGFIHQLGEWVLRKACQDFYSWLEAGLPLERLAVNVSVIQLLESNFAPMVFSILEETGLDPVYLELEITESQTANLQTVKSQIELLREHGVRFAIDDFGTGFSSIHHLRVMGFDTIKIDKGFIHNVLHDNKDQVIVESILNMAHLLRLNIIAEGVETSEQARYVETVKIEEVQGYYYSPPIDKDRFENMMKELFLTSE